MSPAPSNRLFRYPSSPLTSERLEIRQIRHEDLTDLFAVHSVDAVNRFLPYSTWRNEDDAQAWWERVQQRTSDGKAMQFVICDVQAARVMGACILFAYDREHQRAELGYAIGQAYWGKGYAREAMLCFLDYAFNDIGLRRVEARVDTRNQASIQLLLRLGFTEEGCLRQWGRDHEGCIDLQLYGLLRHEWSQANDKTG